jgi:hypothetical protein
MGRVMAQNLMLILGAVAPEKFPKAAKAFAEECDKILREELTKRSEAKRDV